MTRAELVRELAAAREEFVAALAGLDEAQLADPGVADGWSAKDLMAHVTAWEAELLKGLAQGRAGKRPAYFSLTDADIDARNAQWRKEFKGKALAKVLEDYQTVRGQTLRQVERLTDEDLNDPKKFSWTKGESLAQSIQSDTFGHDREHIAEIQKWRDSLA
jgi:uncharacterized protein (TIGR03083 family)